ncbi:uncharacterized protein LOC134220089 isoform X2 [Armigeres subalbatus]|uniref:uncharacterized protein LOC134220089 isoform X2 n=1 Tax=Armigeres subalbatus TaxID=124917 RepID=UPI002ED469AC
MSFILKYWFNIENIYQTIQPACRSMKWFGFMPFTLLLPERNGKGRTVSQLPATLAFKKLDVLLLLLWQIYILSIFNAHWFSQLSNAPMSKIMIYLSILLYIVETVMVSWVQLRIALSRNKIDELLRLIRFSDELIEPLGFAVNHRRHHLGLVLLILGTIICTICVMAVEFVLGDQFHSRSVAMQERVYSSGATIYYFILRTAQVCPLVVFLGAILAFRSRFRLLNAAFRNIFLEGKNDSNDKDMENRLRVIVVGHDTMTEAVELFNDIFGLQMVFACSSYIIYCVFSMFCVGALYSRKSLDVLFLTLIYAMPFLHYSVHIMPIIKISSDVQHEGKRIAVLVHKAINQSPLSVSSINRLMVFSRQLQQQTPAVSSGMFSFDWTLCFSMLSTVATYTMILVQFELEVPKFFLDALVRSTMERDAALNATRWLRPAENDSSALDMYS